MPMPYKGARMRAYTRVKPDVLADAQRLADERKMGLSDWIAEAMEQKVKRDKAKSKVAA
jgi:predicted HicB family RNase H-like nuclease